MTDRFEVISTEAAQMSRLFFVPSRKNKRFLMKLKDQTRGSKSSSIGMDFVTY
jgi:hypothetical protein